MRNWKTTLTGIALLFKAAMDVINGAPDENTMTAATAGVGLLLAKDHNVTGGTKE